MPTESERMSYHPGIALSGPGSLRTELTVALVQEATRLRSGQPPDEDKAARLSQLLDLWRGGHRGTAPPRLPPQPAPPSIPPGVEVAVPW